MRIDGFDCEGWAQVADALGCSQNHARMLERRASSDDPMPVSMVGRQVIAKGDELRAWAARQVRPRQRQSVA